MPDEFKILFWNSRFASSNLPDFLARSMNCSLDTCHKLELLYLRSVPFDLVDDVVREFIYNYSHNLYEEC